MSMQESIRGCNAALPQIFSLNKRFYHESGKSRPHHRRRCHRCRQDRHRSDREYHEEQLGSVPV